MEVNTSMDISSNPAKVFSWIEIQDKAMRWQKGVKRAQIINDAPGKVGTTFKEELEENGKRLLMFGEITGYIPDKLISFHLKSKVHHVYVSYIVSGDQDKSTVTIDSKIKWKFPMNIICLFIGNKIKANILKQTVSELTVLKKLCETE